MSGGSQIPIQVSVILPAYNAEQFIKTALRSALGQSLLDIEVIVVDDGSTDDTAAIVAAFCQLDSRVVLYRHEKSRGPSAARNTAIRYAKGIWLAPLDADDEFASDRLEKMILIANSNRFDVVADGIELVDFDTRQSIGQGFDPDWMIGGINLTLKILLLRDCPGLHSCMGFGFAKPIIRNAFVKAKNVCYAEDLRLGEDLLFYANLLLNGARFGVTDKTRYRYSVRVGSLSLNPKPTSDMIIANTRITERVMELKSTLKDAPSLLEILRKRDRALRFQLLTWYVRLGMIRKASETAKSLPFGFISHQVLNRILKKFNQKIFTSGREFFATWFDKLAHIARS